jgi:ankyrin repeat protein
MTDYHVLSKVKQLIERDYPKYQLAEIIRLIVENGYVFSSQKDLFALKRTITRSEWVEAVQEVGHKHQGFIQTTAHISSSRKEYEWTLAHLLTNFGYTFSISELLLLGNPKNSSSWTVAHEMANVGHRFSISELLTLGNPPDNDGDTPGRVMAAGGFQFSFSDLMKLGNPANKNGVTIAHEQLSMYWKPRVECGKADRRKKFAMFELKQLGNPADKDGETLAHLMAYHGYNFSLSELTQLGNPKDKNGQTAAHNMAENGHRFSSDEIRVLCDPMDKRYDAIPMSMAMHGHQFSWEELLIYKDLRGSCNATIAHWMAKYGHHFSLEELLQIGNQVISYSKESLYDSRSYCNVDEEEYYRDNIDVMHNGATVAHIMAREGHRFTNSEIEALGNPKDAEGLTIADWMTKRKVGRS